MASFSTPAVTAVAAACSTRERRGGVVAAFLELSKHRLSLLVLMTTAVGFALASLGEIDWFAFGMTLVGTGLSAFGANAFNQIIEAPRDARMRRTAARPIPAGRIARRTALVYAAVVSLAGPAILLVSANPLAAGLALGCELLYVLAYTPLKTRTSLNTLVGAAVGAIPPMVGWASAAGALEPGAWVLAAILFVWQIPHFLALAWMYREDYARGGFRMLPANDATGERTAQAAVLYSLTLVPVSLLLTAVGAVGMTFAVCSAIAALGLCALAMRFYQVRSDLAARRLFLASVLYLPLVLSIMVLDRGGPPLPAGAVTESATSVRLASLSDRGATP